MNTTKQPQKSFMLRTVIKNWPVLAGLIVTFLLWQWNAVPTMLRTLVMVPMFMFTSLASYLVVRSVFCRLTTDKLGDDAQDVAKEWEALAPGERIKLLILERVGFMIAGAIIIMGMLIIYGGPSGAAAAIEATK